MDKWVIKECLEQLLKVQVYSEQQYLHAAIDSSSPLLKDFFEQRAFERSDGILKIQRYINSSISGKNTPLTIEK